MKLIALLVVTVAIYAPLRSGAYVYEDLNWLQSHTPIVWRVPGRALSMWTLKQTTDPGTAHLVNVGLHLTAGVLVAGIGTTVAGPIAGLIAAGIVLLHPLNSEAVAYVSARTDLLMTVGILLACWAAVQAGIWRWPVVALGLIVAALSKEVGIVGGGLVLLVLWRWRASESSTWWLLRVSSVVSILGAALTMPTWGPWLSLTMANGGSALAWPDYLSVQSTAVLGLLRRVLWPTAFTIDHDWLAVSRAWQGVSVGVVLVALGLTIEGLRRGWAWAWMGAWIGLSVGLRFVVRSNELLNEHQFYLVMSGLAIAAGCVLSRAVTRERRTA